MKRDWITYTHNKHQVTTVGDFIKSDGPASLIANLTARELVEFRENGNSIFSQYNAFETKENNDKIQANNDEGVTLKPGTILDIPVKNLNLDVLYKAGRNVVYYSRLKPFMANELTYLLRDQGYRQEMQISGGGGRLISNHIKYTVIAYSKVLDKFINISPFVYRVSTSVGKQGGAWTLELSPILGKCDIVADKPGGSSPSSFGWHIEPFSHISKNGEHTNTAHLHKSEGVRSTHYFNNVLCENDVIFIKYSDLPLEEKGGKFTTESMPGQIWDMIGLVDTVRITADNPTEVGIKVDGRDMMKVMIEDGSYFFPGALNKNIFANEPDGVITTRSRVSGKLQGYFSYYFRGILDTLQFVISQFSTTGLVPDHVFKAWGEARSLRVKLPNQNTPNNNEVIDNFTPQKGVWGIIRLLVDESVSKRQIVDATIAQEQGSMINSVNKICQEPFVEFSGDTYGSVYVFKATKPPYDKVGYTGMCFDDVEEVNYNYSQKNVVVITKPKSEPHAKRSISSIVIDIDESEVMNDAFEFSTEVYSWYRIIPKASLGSTQDAVILEYLPAISFEQYAQVWGSRVNAIETNYLNYIPLEDSKSLSIVDTVSKQAVEDLRYMVQSCAYLPFSRQGGITIHLNRLIKRGTMIYYKPTDEIFFVDQVNHDASITEGMPDGTTTLNVTRGLRREYIRGKNGISYFDIINTDIPQNYVNARDVLKTWHVNDEVFDFFMNRRQFA